MRNRILGKWKTMSLQQKLTTIFVLAGVMILAVNLYMSAIINGMTGRVDEVYMSNVRMNELSAALDQVQSSTEDYLNTKSSEAMEEYYRSEQEFRRQIDGLNTQVTDDVLLLTEKNIRGLSENYLSLVDDIIQAKRGRNVERYGSLYEEACVLYEEIHTFIYHRCASAGCNQHGYVHHGYRRLLAVRGQGRRASRSRYLRRGIQP